MLDGCVLPEMVTRRELQLVFDEQMVSVRVPDVCPLTERVFPDI
jgi:hypothetical protein